MRNIDCPFSVKNPDSTPFVLYTLRLVTAPLGVIEPGAVNVGSLLVQTLVVDT